VSALTDVAVRIRLSLHFSASGSTAETTLLQFSRRRMATGARGIQAVLAGAAIILTGAIFGVQEWEW
jgi:hypothetical protein